MRNLSSSGESHGLASVVTGSRQRQLVHEATVPSRVIVVPGRIVSAMIDEDRDVAHGVLTHLASRLLSVEDRLLDTLLLSKSDLVVRMLGRMAEMEGGSRARTVWITHQELAWLAGCTRETTTVVLSRLRNEGIVATRPGRVEILDRVRLTTWRAAM